MHIPLKRTYLTSLTDDELILLDCLWSAGARWELLRRESFAQEWNGESHNLDDDQLLEALRRFVGFGLLRIEDHGSRSSFWMTESGGRKWEAERLPVWDRFARDRYMLSKHRKTVLTIHSTTAINRDGLWDLGRRVGMFYPVDGTIKIATLHDYPLVSWKQFPQVYQLEAEVSQLSIWTDWQAYEEQRAWWRNIRENDKFWGEKA